MKNVYGKCQGTISIIRISYNNLGIDTKTSTRVLKNCNDYQWKYIFSI